MRTEAEINADYREFRGRCLELCTAAIKADPTLRMVRGWYFEPWWAREEMHWWCVKPDGTIVDPSARQFPSNGNPLCYREFNGVYECEVCDCEFPEAQLVAMGTHTCCSTKCAGILVGIDS